VGQNSITISALACNYKQQVNSPQKSHMQPQQISKSIPIDPNMIISIDDDSNEVDNATMNIKPASLGLVGQKRTSPQRSPNNLAPSSSQEEKQGFVNKRDAKAAEKTQKGLLPKPGEVVTSTETSGRR
jgi:hypothetical protein